MQNTSVKQRKRDSLQKHFEYYYCYYYYNHHKQTKSMCTEKAAKWWREIEVK